MKKQNTILESRTKIRFQDCDPFNHLNNGRYLDYFINAREDQLLEYYDIDIFRIAREQGLGWVVSSSQVAYLKPVFTMEEVVIETQLVQYADKHLLVEARMWDRDKNILKSLAWLNFVHFNLRTNKVQKHPEEFLELFREILLPVKNTTFEERHKSFRFQKTS
ncbi:acyl-CoA thioesterase [Sinomicrobium weinanense]|uniref:Acyl-CoA thioesterase n=1 Tax=Sinomicrobium weinanense TaxID=2842200 RepID=A0A926Q2B1_9FLAO|nr:acyl-CoA thioesterase [Sinomicrobium weinanense]MBC9796328.1 acyl-CoA thioesterase [Sinomicrobium weinanense]MBU3122470.1 acyl-CoA thioesterase [Sinomicrobium weinanense]